MTLMEYLKTVKNLPHNNYFDTREALQRLYEQYQASQNASMQEFLRTPIEQVMYGNGHLANFLHFVNHIGPLQIAAIAGGIITAGCLAVFLKRYSQDFMSDRAATLIFAAGIGIIFALGVLL